MKCPWKCFVSVPVMFAAYVLMAPVRSAEAQAASPQLTFVLKQMDTASKSFQRATADFQWDYYERAVHDTSTQKGTIYFQRSGSSMDMGAVISDPSAGAKQKPVKVLQYQSGTLQMFDPGVDQITVLHAGTNHAQTEAFLTLGFGGSGTDLAKAWEIKDLGPETMQDGVKVEKLDLVSKDEEGRKNFSHVAIWLDPARGIALKQVFYTASGNFRTATYSNIRINGNVHKDQFAIKRDKNTTVINH